jgi:hypothetical protein
LDDELAGMKKNRRQAQASRGLKNRTALYSRWRVCPRGGFAQQIVAQRHDGDQHK